jgi:hypothetical protein
MSKQFLESYQSIGASKCLLVQHETWRRCWMVPDRDTVLYLKRDTAACYLVFSIISKCLVLRRRWLCHDFSWKFRVHFLQRLKSPYDQYFSYPSNTKHISMLFWECFFPWSVWLNGDYALDKSLTLWCGVWYYRRSNRRTSIQTPKLCKKIENAQHRERIPRCIKSRVVLTEWSRTHRCSPGRTKSHNAWSHYFMMEVWKLCWWTGWEVRVADGFIKRSNRRSPVDDMQKRWPKWKLGACSCI